MEQGRKALVLLSGGLDSTVLLASTLDEGYETYALSVYYGQRHARELASASAIAEHYRLPRPQAWERIMIPESILASPNSSQTSVFAHVASPLDVPEGHYAEENMKATVVPNRNMVLLAIATAKAITIGATEIRYAAHAGDHAIYPDCRPGFVNAMSEAISRCDWHPPKLVAPFLAKSKADIVRIGTELGVPFYKTWTCYKGAERACGRCGTCVERLEAFALAEAHDPLLYEDREFWRTATETKR